MKRGGTHPGVFRMFLISAAGQVGRRQTQVEIRPGLLDLIASYFFSIIVLLRFGTLPTSIFPTCFIMPISTTLMLSVPALAT